MWQQLKNPNLSVTGQVGWCLKYARDVFGVGAVYPNAIGAWNATKYKHLDRNFPNVAVPVWFSYKTDGHVVVYVPGKGFYSSPYKSGQSYYVGTSIADIEAKYASRFLGWSEDINNVRVAQEGKMIPDQDNYFNRYNKLMLQVRGRQMTRDEFRKNIVGVSDLTAVERISDNAESDRATDYQQWALANKATVEKRIVDLQKMVDSINAQVAKLSQTISEQTAIVNGQKFEIGELADENAKLKTQLSLQSQDTANLNKIGELFIWFATRIGIKKG